MMYLEMRERDRPVKPSSTQASENILLRISAGQSLIAERMRIDAAGVRVWRGSRRRFDFLPIWYQ
jgi:hypothetical protein